MSGLVLIKEGNTFVLRNADDPSRSVGDWRWRAERDEETGQVHYRIYREAYSGILTGDFGRSYRFRKPVLELIAERLPVSIQFGIISFVLSYAISIYLGVQKGAPSQYPLRFCHVERGVYDLLDSWMGYWGGVAGTVGNRSVPADLSSGGI